ncbi:hypothetical protein LTS08_007644 [Lithohypha guttulata]|nr:hypothetical protein LTS08_007644 [Lithohypha guttulata]
MGVFAWTKWLFLLIGKFIFYTLLVSLPITIFDIPGAILDAVTFHFWAHSNVVRHSNALKSEAEMNSFTGYFDMPSSGLSMRQFQDQKGPFHIPSIRSFDWTESLGLQQPRELRMDLNPDLGIDRTASFDGLVRDVRGRGRADALKAKSLRVYVASLPEWSPTMWDEAFDQILQESRFLCGVWSVKTPSLLHFSVGKVSVTQWKAMVHVAHERDDELDDDTQWFEDGYMQGYTYDSPDSYLYPVKVKVIELPLEDEYAASLLPRGTFPTPLLQLRAILQDPRPSELLSHWEPHNVVRQLMTRFNDHINDLYERRGTWRYYLGEAETWYTDTILNPVLGKDLNGDDRLLTMVRLVTFSTTALLAEIVWLPCHIVWEFYAWYLGLGWDGEPVDSIVEPPVFGGSGGSPNFMDDMFMNAMAMMGENIQEQVSESAGRAAVTERAQTL